MAYSVVKDGEGIISVTYKDKVDLAERYSAVSDACKHIDDIAAVRLLIDVREVVVNMTLNEQKTFGNFLANKYELSEAKVAVLHKSDNNPNQAIDTYAYMQGYHLVEFTDPGEARLWLKGAIA
ncbi:hypothetical protein [Motiliproteus sp. MSK22-1]|uniref:hypothetical protein n=1 Tax=Motiliproteus sp. MSK22-1 TaxID=1897630 RepID=UPI0009779576|nr:hypothetical protein [Motiliproteus sp. MSK22-1]OMH25801.1 hypothetical protein BGP75_25090 [Motiliproteus sp. MSK22-1]